MAKARTDVATPAVSINSAEIAHKIIQLINSRPRTPSVMEIAAVIDQHGPEVTEFPALIDWRRRAAENKAAWAALENSPEPDDEVADHIDDELHAHAHKLMLRQVMTWEDVAVLGELAMYWLYSGDKVFGESLRYDMQERTEGYDVQIIAHLLNGIARLTGGQHV